MSVTEQEVKESKLEEAFRLKRELNLNLTLKQSRELNDILCNLATAEFNRGLDKGFEIGNKYRS